MDVESTDKDNGPVMKMCPNVLRCSCPCNYMYKYHLMCSPSVSSKMDELYSPIRSSPVTAATSMEKLVDRVSPEMVVCVVSS